MVWNARTLSWNSGCLQREPRKRHNWGRTVLDVGGAEGLVRDMISWMASRSFSRCSGLLMPISRWISVSDRADMMAPLFTLARQAATYQAGIPTQSWGRGTRGRRLGVAAGGPTHQPRAGVRVGPLTHLQPDDNSRPVPLRERQALSPGFLEQLVPASNETFKVQGSLVHTDMKQVSLSIYPIHTPFKSEIVRISSSSFNLLNHLLSGSSDILQRIPES